jgi:hypothetical protein
VKYCRCSSALLSRYELVAEGAEPEPDREEVLDLAEDGVEAQACPVLSRPAELSKEELRGGGEGDVAVPAVPGAAFEVIQAEGGLQFAAVVFDPPRLLDAV